MSRHDERSSEQKDEQSESRRYPKYSAKCRWTKLYRTKLPDEKDEPGRNAGARDDEQHQRDQSDP
jgi:hypothetical protein